MTDWRSDDHNPEGCPGCRPVVFDPATGKLHERLTATAERVFDRSSPETRRAWHRFTCLNSRDLIDVNLARGLMEALQREATTN
jgi:hypothetical protein